MWLSLVIHEGPLAAQAAAGEILISGGLEGVAATISSRFSTQAAGTSLLVDGRLTPIVRLTSTRDAVATNSVRPLPRISIALNSC